MVCPHCLGADTLFNQQFAASDLNDYRKNGPSEATKLLLQALRQHPLHDLTLLDVGGGVGVLQHELVAQGVANTTDVDASSAYLQRAQEEAQRRGYVDRAHYLHGDFVQLAPQVAPADVVTLDRVICCYPDMEALVTLSADRARQFYGVIYPRENPLVRVGIALLNTYFRLRGNPFRNYLHSTARIDGIIREKGFQPIYQGKTLVWQIWLYQRL